MTWFGINLLTLLVTLHCIMTKHVYVLTLTDDHVRMFVATLAHQLQPKFLKPLRCCWSKIIVQPTHDQLGSKHICHCTTTSLLT